MIDKGRKIWVEKATKTRISRRDEIRLIESLIDRAAGDRKQVGPAGIVGLLTPEWAYEWHRVPTITRSYASHIHELKINIVASTETKPILLIYSIQFNFIFKQSVNKRKLIMTGSLFSKASLCGPDF